MDEKINIINTSKGSTFFVDLDKVIKDEIKKEKKSSIGKQNNGTVLFIPLFENRPKSKKKKAPSIGKKDDALNRTFTKEDFVEALVPDPTAKKTEKDSDKAVAGHGMTSKLLTLSKSVEQDCIEREVKTLSCLSQNPSKNVHTVLEHNQIIAPLLQLHKLITVDAVAVEIGTEACKKLDAVEPNCSGKLDPPTSSWTKNNCNLPKLPDWARGKNLSVDSSVYPFPSPSEAKYETHNNSCLTIKNNDISNQNCKIEELFPSPKVKEQKYITAVLPPILRPSSSRPCSSKVSPHLKRKKAAILKKNTQLAKTCKEKINPSKLKVSKTSKKSSKKKGKVKKTSIQESANNSNAKDTETVDKTEMEPELHLDLGIINANAALNLEAGVVDAEPDEKGIFQCECPIDDGNKVISLPKTSCNSSVDGSMFEFYENCALFNQMENEERKSENQDQNMVAVSLENLTSLTVDKITMHNSQKMTLEKSNIDYFLEFSPRVLIESVEKSLSLDSAIDEVPSPRKTQLSIFPHNNFLSKISEEQTQSASFRSRISKYNNSQHDLGPLKHNHIKRTGASMSIDEEDSSFVEMSHLMFNPGIVPDITSSLQSGSMDDASFSESTISNDRPFVRSVLGSARGDVYSSASSHASVLTEHDIIEWQKGKMIDRGAFGVVYQGLTSKAQLIAVKEVHVGNSKQAAKNYKKLQDEIGILKGLHHRNVIKFIGTTLEDNLVYIFMEYIAGGSLAGLIASFGPLKESIYQRYTKQIMSAVHYLHSEGVIHRDIKGANILVTVKGTVKLIDFGCAKELSLSLGSTVLLKSVKGTPYWMAPEVIHGTGCNHKSDIWSVGCTVMEMATGKPPWSEFPPYAAMYAIAENSNEPPELEERHSDMARTFVASCLNRDMLQRPSAEELLSHPFICF